MSVRDDAGLFLQSGKGRGGAGTAMGGNATTTTNAHRLDGPEHASADDTTRLDASTTQHGLLPKLSGDPDDVLLGDGTFAPPPEPVAVAHIADTTDAHDASAVSFVPTGTIAATDVQAAIAEVAAESLSNPMTTQDDIIVAGVSGVPARLGKGSDGQVLTVDPTTHHLVWATPSGGGGGSGILAQASLVPSLYSASWKGYVTSASESLSAINAAPWQPWHEGAGTNGSAMAGWLDNGSALPQWLQIQLPAAVVCNAYAMMPWWVDNFPTRTPKTWTFAGSNDGSSWTTLDTVTNNTTWPIGVTMFVGFSFTNTTAYSYYRWTVSANIGGNAYMGIGGLRLYGPGYVVQS